MSITEFGKLRSALQQRVAKMAKSGPLFVSSVSKDEIWDTYLNSFPEGTNPMFRERTEHDCVCCKQFIRYVGRIVGEIDGKLTSVWDVETGTFYDEVAKAMSAVNLKTPISGIFLHNEREIGKDHTFEINEDGTTRKWEHFHQVVPESAFMKVGLGEAKGSAQTNKSVLTRSLEEITDEAVDIVLELIGQSAIYRGEEHLNTVKLVATLKRELKSADNKELYLWKKAVQLKGVCSLRNTVIGTLLVDISEGTDLEVAVKKFEDKVAPHNYKRTTSLVTPKMKEAAKEKAKELGIEPSLLRRHANKADISVNDILFADSAVVPFMEDSVFDTVKTSKSVSSQKFDKVQEVTIDAFLKDILPKAETLEVFVENRHKANMMSLIAPIHATAPGIMKWNNNFSWTYNGDITDSDIRQRVKAAGGVVDAPFRISLSWNHRDDLDLHVIREYRTGNSNQREELYFCYKDRFGAKLDVDMRGERNDQVENVFWSNLNKLEDGKYTVKVNRYSSNSQRSGDPARVEGFELEVELNGDRFNLNYPTKLTGSVEMVKFEVIKGKVVFNEQMKTVSSEAWGKNTGEFHKVNMVMLSPNHWENTNKTGNKHFFFIVDGMVNPDDCTGFYNEFLREELSPHRKVFEMLASSLRVQYNDEQLSGLGFSSTQRNDVLVKVTGSFSRVVKIKF